MIRHEDVSTTSPTVGKAKASRDAKSRAQPPTNPYPDDWRALSGFFYHSALSLIRPVNAVQDRLGEDGDYILQHDFDCAVAIDGDPVGLTAPRGMVTDLATVPPLFRFFVGRVGPWLEAAILHDWLYVAWCQVPGRGPLARDRLFADRVMLLAMERARVPALRRYAIYGAVRLFGIRAYRRGNLRFVDLDAPALETALVLPERT